MTVCTMVEMNELIASLARRLIYTSMALAQSYIMLNRERHVRTIQPLYFSGDDMG